MKKMKLITNSNTHVGLVRKANEDNFGNLLVPDKPNLWIVCDGMGGHVGGAVASKMAVDSILEYWKSADLADIQSSMVQAIQFANSQIVGHVVENPNLKGMGTTVVMMAERNGEFTVAHVGDSRAYIFDQRELCRLTKDHSYVQQLVDQGIIKDEDAEKHPQKNRILRALGISKEVDVEISQPICPSRDAIFMLCSDGMCGMMNDFEMLHVFLQKMKGDLNDLVSDLISGALSNGGLDNVTVTSVKVEDSPFQKSTFQNFNPKSDELDLGKTSFSGLEIAYTDLPKPTLKKQRFSKKQILLIAVAAVTLISIAFGGLVYFEVFDLKK